MVDFAKGFQQYPLFWKYEYAVSLYGVCVCYMYWIQNAPASCRQWSKETLVCKSLVCLCLLSWTLPSVFFPLLLQKSTGNVTRLWILVICTMADVVVLNLWHYKHWPVLSCLVTTITINLFCFKGRGDQNILSVKWLYYIIFITLK